MCVIVNSDKGKASFLCVIVKHWMEAERGILSCVFVSLNMGRRKASLMHNLFRIKHRKASLLFCIKDFVLCVCKIIPTRGLFLCLKNGPRKMVDNEGQ